MNKYIWNVLTNEYGEVYSMHQIMPIILIFFFVSIRSLVNIYSLIRVHFPRLKIGKAQFGVIVNRVFLAHQNRFCFLQVLFLVSMKSEICPWMWRHLWQVYALWLSLLLVSRYSVLYLGKVRSNSICLSLGPHTVPDIAGVPNCLEQVSKRL